MRDSLRSLRRHAHASKTQHAAMDALETSIAALMERLAAASAQHTSSDSSGAAGAEPCDVMAATLGVGQQQLLHQSLQSSVPSSASRSPLNVSKGTHSSTERELAMCPTGAHGSH